MTKLIVNEQDATRAFNIVTAIFNIGAIKHNDEGNVTFTFNGDSSNSLINTGPEGLNSAREALKAVGIDARIIPAIKKVQSAPKSKAKSPTPQVVKDATEEVSTKRNFRRFGGRFSSFRR